MKRLSLLAIAFFVALSLWAAYIPAGTMLYLDASAAWTGNDNLTAYFFSTSTDGNYVTMQAVAGENRVFSVAAPAGGPWTNVIFRQHSTPQSAAALGTGSDILYRTATLTWGGYQTLYAVTCDLCTTEGIDNIANGEWRFFIPLPTAQPTDLGITANDYVRCDTIESKTMTLQGADNLMFYQWFQYSDGVWSRVSGTSDEKTAFFPSDTKKDTYYYLYGEQTGSNSIVNGDFEQGNTGFTSEYTYKAATANSILYDEGIYTIVTDVLQAHSTAQVHSDHTTGSGYMMAVNGDTEAGKIVWEQTITGLKQYSSYVFSAWVINWDLENHNMAQLEFRINGTLQGERFSPVPGYHWTQLYTVWNSGDATSATITLVNWQNAPAGNDFCIDDITFSEMNSISRLYHLSYKDCTVEPEPEPTPEPTPEPIVCEDLVYRKWTDVLFCNNADSLFTSYQWYADSVAIADATEQFLYRPTDMLGHSYYVIATDKNGKKHYSCDETFDETTRSLDAQPKVKTLLRLHEPIQIQDISEESVVRIYDMLGSLCIESRIRESNSEIEQNLPQGSYIISISTPQKQYTERMIIL